MDARLLILFACACGAARGAPATAPPEDRAARAARELEARCDRGDALPCYAAAALAMARDEARSQRLRDRGNELTLRACTARDADVDACRRVVISGKLAFAKTTDEAERRPIVAAIVAAGTRACHAGDHETCIDVAAILHKGESIDVDRARARELVGFACVRDHQPACVELALALANDPIEPSDRARAVDLLEAACAKSDAKGCAMFAALRLADGPTAATGARDAARRSCELGDAAGCAVFGHTLHAAIGGPADLEGARAAFESACRGGDRRGCIMVKRLAP